MAVSINEEVFFVGALLITALLFGVLFWAGDFWQVPCWLVTQANITIHTQNGAASSRYIDCPQKVLWSIYHIEIRMGCGIPAPPQLSSKTPQAPSNGDYQGLHRGTRWGGRGTQRLKCSSYNFCLCPSCSAQCAFERRCTVEKSCKKDLKKNRS